MEGTKRLKVLISAYACSPYRGSEHAVGWGFVKALSRRHDLWVITEEEKCRADIERFLSENPGGLSGVEFHFLRKRRNRTLRKVWPPSYYWYYRQWHWRAHELAEHLHAEVGFDLVHQLTMVGFREPGYLWRLGIPFVWGPVGGMGLFPWRFLPQVGVYGALYYLGYNLYNLCQLRILRRPKLAAMAAGKEGLLLANKDNFEGARRHWGVTGTVMPEVGLPCEPLIDVPQRKLDEPLRIVWTGLHVPRKALNLGLQALSLLPSSLEWELHVLGEGPRSVAWKKLARRLGLMERCHFHGWLEREKALSIMKNGHLLLITSLRDLTSTVTVEALAFGLPVICLDHCGFAEVVDESCGIRIPVTTPQKVVQGLAKAVEELARDESFRYQLARGALNRARDFDWDRKGRVVDRCYRAVTGRKVP